MKKIYTDGACSGNPGPGGWGAVFIDSEDQESPGMVLSGGSKGRTTNNLMEMEAVLQAMKVLVREKAVETVTIISDSQYVVKGLTEWMDGWVRKDWRGANKKPVANKEKWLELKALKDSLPNVKFEWVKGHSGHKWNDIADALANGEAGIK